MRRALASIAILSGLASTQQFPAAGPRVVEYTMTARLDAEARRIDGTQRIVWRNVTPHAVDELRLHLYWNAFRGPDTSFMREAGPEFRALWRDDEYGGIELTGLELVDGTQRSPLSAEFVQPDDGNAADLTVLRVPLPQPLPGGASLVLETRFVARAPKAYRRAGWLPDDGFFCMHWFPKPGVLEPVDGEARWNCHQFHAHTEFFADFASFDVTLDVPAGYVVGATGGRPVQDQTALGRRVLRFTAADVHDFAWVADPDFIERRETFDGRRAVDDPSGLAPAIARYLGVDPASFGLPKLELRLLLQPEHASEEQVRRHFDAARTAIEFYGLRFGPWPFDALTLVDPGSDVLGRSLGGGMEYPMLITCGTELVLHPRRASPESVTIHEFGHQYWYALSANDEVREPWLDEGINSFAESRAQVLAYGDTRRPVRTTAYGPLQLAAVQVRTVPAAPLQDYGVLPFARFAPEPVLEWAAANHFDGTLIPRSPLLTLLFEQPSLSGFREVSAHPEWADRARFVALANPDAMTDAGWRMHTREGYHVNAYERPATLLRQLERMVGRERFWAFLRRFHADTRFAHPTGADFVAALARDCGEDAAAFFRRATEAGAVLDYAVHSVSPADGRGEDRVVTVRSDGTLRQDVRIRFRFEGRDTPLWRSIERDDPALWWSFRFGARDETGPLGRLLEVWIDPPTGTGGDGAAIEADDGLVGTHVLDAELGDNVWVAEPDRRPGLYVALRTLLQTQVRLLFAAFIG